MKKKFYIGIGVLAIFFLIMLLTSGLGELFGKQVEIGALIVVALVLVILLIRDR